MSMAAKHLEQSNSLLQHANIQDQKQDVMQHATMQDHSASFPKDHCQICLRLNLALQAKREKTAKSTKRKLEMGSSFLMALQAGTLWVWGYLHGQPS